MSKKNNLVIWDFDGVIVSTLDACFEIKKMEEPDLTIEEYLKRFEGNINMANTRNKSTKKIDFFAEYTPRLMQKVLVEGIGKAIRSLAENYPQVIVSSTNTGPITQFLEKYNLREYFGIIYGNDIDFSKVEKIKMALRDYEVQSKDCLFITDTLGDLREARECSVDAVAVTWGYHPRETLLRGEPNFIVEQPKQILSAINSKFHG